MLTLLLTANATFAQTTSFTYQGRLTDGGTPANGNYDLQFALFDSASGGTQTGAPQTVSNVLVSAGIFTVTLDFGANAFPGPNRFLEISARLSGAGSFTLLSPRQQISSTPYAVRSLNALSADTIPVNAVPAGSGNYIQNATSQQVGANFNISGNGLAGGTLSGNTVNATTQYNLNGSRILSSQGIENLVAGVNAGVANTGCCNSFFGVSTGFSNTTGHQNSFFGSAAGGSNTTASLNSFFGERAGALNTTGDMNSFFGDGAGFNNRTGVNNAFFGVFAGGNNTANNNAFFGYTSGQSNTSGAGNAFFGYGAGFNNTGGAQNTFVGPNTGLSNTTESNNTFIGNSANGSPGITNATAIGSTASVTQSNAVVLGNGADVGIGASAPKARLHVQGGHIYVFSAGQGIILKSPDGATCRLLTIDNAGAIAFSAITCP